MNAAITKTLKLSTALMLLITLFVTGCKKVFDEPPYPEEPDLTATTTIADLKQKYPNAQEITEDIILKALVVGDDRSGNIYKKIVVQDQSGAIELQLDANNIFNSFPVGSWVYIKAKGLSIGKYNELPQLGLGLDGSQAARIPSAVMNNYLVRSYSTDVIKPLPLTISELGDQHLNMLIELQNVQFAAAELKKTYANAANPGGTQNRIAEDCDNNTITLRMSDYANFAGDSVAKGKGTIVGIYSKFNTTKQFTVRGVEDFAGLTGLRCDGSDGSGETNLTLITIAELRTKIDLANTQHNDEVTLPSGQKIKGIIISNPANESSTNIRIQEPNGSGILIYVPDAVSNGGLLDFTPGKEVEVNISNQKLINYNLDYELKANFENVKLTGNTGTITPRPITLAEAAANISAWSSTLVKINGDFVVSSSGTGNVTYTLMSKANNAESITSFVRSGLGYTLPTTVSSITGYLSKFNSNIQINIRSADDVVEGDGVIPPPPVLTSINEDFSSLTAGGNTAGAGTGAPSSSAINSTISSNFASGVAAYSAGGMIKLGTTSGIGSITTYPLDLTANGGTFYVKFDVKGWFVNVGGQPASTNGGSIIVKTSNGQEQTITYNPGANITDLQTKTVTFTGGTNNMTVTFETPTTSYRAFLDNISIKTTP